MASYQEVQICHPFFSLSQRKQNQKVRFEEISLNDAQKITREFYRFFKD
jgi:allophanate hydrolase subunit 2